MSALLIPDEIDVDEIDDLIESGVSVEAFVGKHLRWHDDRLHPLVLLRGGLYMRYLCLCEWCLHRGRKTPHRRTFYLRGGMHKGAWCYAYDHDGVYQANLRDESFQCAECAALAEAPP